MDNLLTAGTILLLDDSIGSPSALEGMMSLFLLKEVTD